MSGEQRLNAYRVRLTDTERDLIRRGMAERESRTGMRPVFAVFLREGCLALARREIDLGAGLPVSAPGLAESDVDGGSASDTHTAGAEPLVAAPEQSGWNIERDGPDPRKRFKSRPGRLITSEQELWRRNRRGLSG